MIAITAAEIVTPTAMPTVFPWPDEDGFAGVVGTLLFEDVGAASIAISFVGEFSWNKH